MTNNLKYGSNKEYPTFGQDPYGRTTSTMRNKRLSAEMSKDMTLSADSKGLIDNYERIIKLQAVVRGWLVRRRRNLSLVPPEMSDLKSGLTTHRNSHRRIHTNNAIADFKSMQEIMRLVIETLMSGNPEVLISMVQRPFLNPRVLQMRVKQAPLDFDADLNNVLYSSQPIFLE
jgi:MORN repeat/IQ calmodulin-binding motif